MRTYWLILLVILQLGWLARASSEQALDPAPELGDSGFLGEEDTGSGSYLGVDTRDVTPDRVSALKLKAESGVEITMVDQDAPAGKAGLKEHDVILTLNGEKVESVEQLRRMIHEIPAGRVITLGISRDGQLMKLPVQLAQRSHKAHFPSMPPMPQFPSLTMDWPVSVVVVHGAMRSGLLVENLTPQLGEFFGAKNGQGVLVRSVEKGSRAEKAGFRAGDVIVRLDKDAVHDTSDFSHALASHRSGGTISVGVIRDKREQTLTLTLPERKQSGDIFNQESLEFPDVDIEADLDFHQLSSEMARLRPQLELAARNALRNTQEVRKQVAEQMKQMKQLHCQQRELQRQMRRQRRKLREQQRQIGQQLGRWIEGNSQI